MLRIRTIIALASIAIMIGAASLKDDSPKTTTIEFSSQNIEGAPPCIKLYALLEKYSEQYGVPFDIAIGVASEETGYRGPFHWSYNPKRISSASAYGAMQIQLRTANGNWDKPVTAKQLMNDLELNVQISMRLLARLKKIHGNWAQALGAYNSGRPIINQYALRISSGKSNPLKDI